MSLRNGSPSKGRMCSHLPSASGFPLVPANRSNLKASYLLAGLALDALYLSQLWQLAKVKIVLCGIYVQSFSFQFPCGQFRTNLKNYDMTVMGTLCVRLCVLCLCVWFRIRKQECCIGQYCHSASG